MKKTSPRPVLSFRKRVVYWLITMAILAFLFVLGGEIIFRIRRVALTARIQASVGNSKSEAGWAIFDDDLHYRNRPNWNDHNSDGMRDDEVKDKKDNVRILLLGDSIGYEGDDVADTYPGQLETLLKSDQSLVSCEVLNTCTKGYTNYQELGYLKKYGFRFDPDVVGVAFCVNDLPKYLHQFDVVDGEIVASTYSFTPEAVSSSTPGIIAPSLFLTWLWHKGRSGCTMVGLRDGTVFECRPDICAAWDEDRWLALESQLEEMASLCQEKNIPLFLVAFPHAEQYLKEYLDKDRDYVLKPQNKLKSICERLKVPYCDLYSKLDKSHFIWDGIHLTSSGRSAVAQEIKEFLTNHRLVPETDSLAKMGS